MAAGKSSWQVKLQVLCETSLNVHMDWVLNVVFGVDHLMRCA